MKFEELITHCSMFVSSFFLLVSDFLAKSILADILELCNGQTRHKHQQIFLKSIQVVSLVLLLTVRYLLLVNLTPEKMLVAHQETLLSKVHVG